MEKRIAILGGGITGLSAAFYLEKAGVKNITLVEAGQLGGKIKTLKEDGFLIEAGPDSFVTLKPHAINLIEELGLSDELIQPKTSDFYILKDGKMLRTPRGLHMMVPMDEEAFMQSELFSEEGKKRALQEKDIPVKESDEDESFASFITRRFGKEMLTNYAEPLFGGIYATPSDQLSMKATFPQLLQMEKSAGSVTAAIKGMAQPKKSTQNRSPFVSLKNGVQSLVEALVKSLKTTEVIQKTVESAYKDVAKNTFTVKFSDGYSIEADKLIIAFPVTATKSIFKNISPEAAEILDTFQTSSSKIITLAYRKEDIESEVSATGFVGVRNFTQKMTASTWSSEKWEGRAPEGVLLARCFYEGGNSGFTEAEEVDAAHKELAKLIGIKAEHPYRSWTCHWHNALPQYRLGHVERAKQLENIISGIPGLELAGAYLTGVGIPDCIRVGKEAAEKSITN